MTLDTLRTLYRLKEVERRGKVKDRQESTAEHVYSSMVLAELMLPRITPPLDAAKVHRLLLVHDWVEVHAGDTFILDEHAHRTQKERERAAAKRLCADLPGPLRTMYAELDEEFITGSTREARFARAIEHLDPMVQSIDRPEEWTSNGFTEEKLRAKKGHLFTEFPPLQEFFEELIAHLKTTHAI